jgi:methyl coenzyme M reductase subunit D
MLPVGFELTISAGERPQTHVTDRTAIGTDKILMLDTLKLQKKMTEMSETKQRCNNNIGVHFVDKTFRANCFIYAFL